MWKGHRTGVDGTDDMGGLDTAADVNADLLAATVFVAQSCFLFLGDVAPLMSCIAQVVVTYFLPILYDICTIINCLTCLVSE